MTVEEVVMTQHWRKGINTFLKVENRTHSGDDESTCLTEKSCLFGFK